MWDRTPSFTALAIAAMVLWATTGEVGRSTDHDDDDEKLVENRRHTAASDIVQAQLRVLRAARTPWLEAIIPIRPFLVNSWVSSWVTLLAKCGDLLPPNAVLQRKLYMDQQVHHTLQEWRTLVSASPSTTSPPPPYRPFVHCLQVLVVGAGYDTLAWRIAEQNPPRDPGAFSSQHCDERSVPIHCFEVDHPATSRIKVRAMRRIYESKSNNETISMKSTGRNFMQGWKLRVQRFMAFFWKNRAIGDHPTPKTTPPTIPSPNVPPNNLHFVALDLSKLDQVGAHHDSRVSDCHGADHSPESPLGQWLIDATDGAYDPTAPTVVVVEGLSMYLTGPQLHRLLQHHLAWAVGSGEELEPRISEQSLTFPTTAVIDTAMVSTWQRPVPSTHPRVASMLVMDYLGWCDSTQTPDLGRWSWYTTRLLKWLVGEPMHWGVAPELFPSFLERGDTQPNRDRIARSDSSDQTRGRQWRVVPETYQASVQEHFITLVLESR